jgi:hypothetical protein
MSASLLRIDGNGIFREDFLKVALHFPELRLLFLEVVARDPVDILELVLNVEEFLILLLHFLTYDLHDSAVINVLGGCNLCKGF